MGQPILGTYQEPAYTKIAAGQARDNEFTNKAEEVLDLAIDLSQKIRELSDIDERYYYLKLSLDCRHGSLLSALEEFKDKLEDVIREK